MNRSQKVVIFLAALGVMTLAIYCEILRARVDNLTLANRQMSKMVSELREEIAIEKYKANVFESVQDVADDLEMVKKASEFMGQKLIVLRLEKVLEAFAWAEAMKQPQEGKKTEVQAQEIEELAIGRAERRVAGWILEEKRKVKLPPSIL